MIEPAWVLAAIASGSVVATGAIAWSQANRVEGLDERLRSVEERLAALRASCHYCKGGE